MSIPLETVAPVIDESGIIVPSFNDVYETIKYYYRQIYGSDIYIEPDSQDGQLIAVMAKMINDCNLAAQYVFQSFSPDFSQGTQLSSLVKINGIARHNASYSSCQGSVVGVAGSQIINGIVQDDDGNLWNLPPLITIPLSGSILVTVTAQEKGTINGPIGFINTIKNPQLGWQSFTSTIEVVPGSPVETDAELRERQTLSTSLPALTIDDSILGAVANVEGVTRSTLIENDTDSVDVNGIPGHSISVVALGGDSTGIAQAISKRKAPGVQTYGATSVVVYDSKGVPSTINYQALSLIDIYFDVQIKALTGYISTTGDSIIQALSDFINALEIGEDVYLSQCMAAASLIDLGLGHTFYIDHLYLDITPSPVATANITIAYNEAATNDIANITLTVI